MDGEIFRRALREIALEQAEVIELAYFNGYSQREVAEMLGVPIGTVKSRTRPTLYAPCRKLIA